MAGSLIEARNNVIKLWEEDDMMMFVVAVLGVAEGKQGKEGWVGLDGIVNACANIRTGHLDRYRNRATYHYVDVEQVMNARDYFEYLQGSVQTWVRQGKPFVCLGKIIQAETAKRLVYAALYYTLKLEGLCKKARLSDADHKIFKSPDVRTLVWTWDERISTEMQKKARKPPKTTNIIARKKSQQPKKQKTPTPTKRTIARKKKVPSPPPPPPVAAGNVGANLRRHLVPFKKGGPRLRLPKGQKTIPLLCPACKMCTKLLYLSEEQLRELDAKSLLIPLHEHLEDDDEEEVVAIEFGMTDTKLDAFRALRVQAQKALREHFVKHHLNNPLPKIAIYRQTPLRMAVEFEKWKDSSQSSSVQSLNYNTYRRWARNMDENRNILTTALTEREIRRRVRKSFEQFRAITCDEDSE